MNTASPLVRGLSLATLAFSSTVLAGDVSPFVVVSSSGQVAGGASAYDFPTGEEAFDDFLHDLDASYPSLPIMVSDSASASTVTAAASGHAEAAATDMDGVLQAWATAGADAYGDGFNHDASADGWAALELAVATVTPVWVRVRLDGHAEAGGGITAYFDHGGSFFEHSGEGMPVEFDYLMTTGSLCRLGADAGGGATGMDGVGSYGSAQASLELLTRYEGMFTLGDNPFDTTGATGRFDMSGHCDPGEFGEDTIESPVYHLFSAPRSGTYTFSTCNQTALDTRIAITNYGPTPDRVIACGDEHPGCEGWTTKVSVHLDASINYTVVLGATFEETGEGTLTISLEGDLDGDGEVNGADLGLLISTWGDSGPGDLDGDGVVGAADLGLLLALFTG